MPSKLQSGEVVAVLPKPSGCSIVKQYKKTIVATVMFSISKGFKI